MITVKLYLSTVFSSLFDHVTLNLGTSEPAELPSFLSFVLLRVWSRATGRQTGLNIVPFSAIHHCSNILDQMFIVISAELLES